MAEIHSLFDSLQSFTFGDGQVGKFYSLPALEKAEVGPISTLPVSLRIVLESVLRNYDGKRVREADVCAIANWEPNAERTAEIPFVVARVVLQDFTGVPLLVDLAAMRSTVSRLGRDASLIEPLVPVDLIVDHSVQVDYSEVPNALQLNMEMEFKRNRARYQFLKWGMQAFNGFSVVPPGIGIIHQVNLEYLAKGVLSKDEVFYPDTLVGTDSHTTMINGLGIVGWGVGGIEAEAGMLGQPVYFLTPDVVGVNLTGALTPGVTATDLVLTLTEMLRKAKVVGKFVEFHGAGAASLGLTDRATIANMAPEYGATMGFFPVDEECCRYLTATGRTEAQVDAFRQYFKAQGLFGMPEAGEIQYSQLLELDLAHVRPSVAGPKRPQDRIDLPDVKAKFEELLASPAAYNKSLADLNKKFVILTGVEHNIKAISGGGGQDMETVPTEIQPLETGERYGGPDRDRDDAEPSHPGPAGGHPARRVPRGDGGTEPRRCRDRGHYELHQHRKPQPDAGGGPGGEEGHREGHDDPGPRSRPHWPPARASSPSIWTRPAYRTIWTGWASRRSATAAPPVSATPARWSRTWKRRSRRTTSSSPRVLSGNRNFEARVHQNVRANFLMSPPLVVAFALAGDGGRGHGHGTHRQGQVQCRRLFEGPLADLGGDRRGAGGGERPPRRTSGSTATSPSRTRSGRRFRVRSARSTTGTPPRPISGSHPTSTSSAWRPMFPKTS